MRRIFLHKHKTLWITLSVLIMAVIAFRLWLPSFALRKANESLRHIDGYEGSIKTVDISLLTGSYTIKDITLSKTSGKIPLPFFAADAINFSLEWGALIKGELVGKIKVEHPTLNYVSGPTENTTQTGIDKDWVKTIHSLMPLSINHFEIDDGIIKYRDMQSTPQIDLQLTNVSITGENMANVKQEEKLMPAVVTGSAKFYEGLAKLTLQLNPFQQTPAFDLRAEITTINLEHLDSFLKAYENFDVQKGTFSLYAEAATRDNRITGYIKPVITGIDGKSWETDDKMLHHAWESVVEFAAWAFKKPTGTATEQVAFEGNIKDAEVDHWSIVGETLQKAFLHGLIPSIDNFVVANTAATKAANAFRPSSEVKVEKKEEKKDGLLKRIFKKNDDKKDDRKARKENRKKKNSNKAN